MLSRQMLEGMGFTDAQVEAVIEGHSDSLKGVKAERDQYKAKAEKYDELAKELEDLKAKGGDDLQGKLDALQKEYDDYKAEVANKETQKQKEAEYRKLCETAGISKSAIDSVIKATVGIKDMTLTKDGNLKDAEKLVEQIKTDWAGFITQESVKGADIQTPPVINNGGGMKKEEIYAKDDHGRYVHSTAERQKALAEQLAKEN